VEGCLGCEGLDSCSLCLGDCDPVVAYVALTELLRTFRPSAMLGHGRLAHKPLDYLQVTFGPGPDVHIGLLHKGNTSTHGNRARSIRDWMICGEENAPTCPATCRRCSNAVLHSQPHDRECRYRAQDKNEEDNTVEALPHSLHQVAAQTCPD